MRPVNKGLAPEKRITNYTEAKPYLIKTIGAYCSYCEFPIFHIPEVEHIVSRSNGGDLNDWDNLLLACKHCNTRKGNTITPDNVSRYMLPDRYNTGIAFSYEYGIPKVNIDELNALDPSGSITLLAVNTFNLVKLGNNPKPGERDDRFGKRLETFEQALECLEVLKKCKESEELSTYKNMIVDLAINMGFYSVWMTVFKEYPEMLKMFIEAFPGTEKRYYCENGLSLHQIQL